MMVRLAVWTGFVALASLGAWSPARAAQQTYVYTVERGPYGDIGTCTDRISSGDGWSRIDTTLHVVVSVLGLVLYREDADRTEIWRGGQLATVDATTDINGKRQEFHGKSRDGQFFVTSASGTTAMPAAIQPSEPWIVTRPGPALMLSTRSGLVSPVNVVGGEDATLSLDGTETPTRHFRVDTETQQGRWDVWLDRSGVPVMFRSLEPAGAVDFVLEAPRPQTRTAARSDQ